MTTRVASSSALATVLPARFSRMVWAWKNSASRNASGVPPPSDGATLNAVIHNVYRTVIAGDRIVEGAGRVALERVAAMFQLEVLSDPWTGRLDVSTARFRSVATTPWSRPAYRSTGTSRAATPTFAPKGTSHADRPREPQRHQTGRRGRHGRCQARVGCRSRSGARSYG